MHRNRPSTSRFSRSACLAAFLAGLVSMTACSRVDTARPDLHDGGSANVVAEGVDEAPAVADERREVSAQAVPQWHETRSEAGDRVADAAITASVNAELSKDDDLSALRIDVDTTNGHVLLKGTAPSPASRERAGRIASSVRGVTSVDNQLGVQP